MINKDIMKAAIIMLSLTACSEDTFDAPNNENGGFISTEVKNTITAEEKLKAEVGDRVFFAFDSSELDQNATATLDRQIDLFKTDNIMSIIIEGHCDDRGTREYNLGLSERRANAVREYILSKFPNMNVSILSYGKDRPIDVPNASDEQEYRQQNRVCITLLK